MPEIYAGPVPQLLEKLDAKVSEFQKKDPFTPVAVIGPSVHSLESPRRVLASSNARAQIYFFTYQSLASYVQRETAFDKPRGSKLWPRDTENAVLDKLLHNHSEGDLGSYLRDFAGARSQLLGTFREFREAQARPEIIQSAALTDQDRQLAHLYAAYCEVLNGMSTQGWFDSAGFIEDTFSGLARGLEQFGGFCHYGAWDMIGIHLNFLKQVEKTHPITWFVPSGPGPAFEKSREFVARHLGAARDFGGSRPAYSSVFFESLEFLFSSQRRKKKPLKKGSLFFAHAQGFESESLAAVRALGAWHLDDNIPLEDMAIVARSMDSYERPLASALDLHGIPWHRPGGTPLLGRPGAQAFRRLIIAMKEGCGRDLLYGLMSSDHFSFSVPDAEKWYKNCRDQKITHGARSLLACLKSKPSKPLRDVLFGFEKFGGTIARVSWQKGVNILAETARTYLKGFEEKRSQQGEFTECQALVEEAAALGKNIFPTESVSEASGMDALAWILKRIEKDRVSMGSPRGVAVLSLMESRGRLIRRAVLLGANQKALPARFPPKVFLGPSLRNRLIEKSNILLSSEESRYSEEKELFASFLASIQERLLVSWQRADESGRALAPSLFLRELQFSGDGQNTMSQDACRLLAHPAESPWVWFEKEWSELGGNALLLPDEALLALAGRSGDDSKTLESFAKQNYAQPEGIILGMRHLNSVESFVLREPGGLYLDGVTQDVGPLLPTVWSPTALATLASCPLQFFFRRVLKVESLADDEAPESLSPMEIGNVLHEALARWVQNTNVSDLKDGPQAVLQMRKTMDLYFEGEQAIILKRRVMGVHPGLWKWVRQALEKWLESFVLWDVPRLQEKHVVDWIAEESLEAELGLPSPGEPGSIHVGGKLDRILQHADGSYIFQDFKASANLAPHIEPKKLLQGRRLQLPIYGLLLTQAKGTNVMAGKSLGEFISVGQGAENLDHREASRNDLPIMMDGIVETIQILVGMAKKGLFPYSSEEPPCSYCEFRSACRQGEAPTDRRVFSAKIFREYHKTQKKTKKNPLISNGADAGE